MKAQNPENKENFPGVEIYKVNRNMLKQAKKRGYCLCDALKKDDGSNICPCNEFLNDSLCKCGVFKQHD